MNALRKEAIYREQDARWADKYKVGTWHAIEGGSLMQVDSITGSGCWMTTAFGTRAYYTFAGLDCMTIKEAAHAK